MCVVEKRKCKLKTIQTSSESIYLFTHHLIELHLLIRMDYSLALEWNVEKPMKPHEIRGITTHQFVILETIE